MGTVNVFFLEMELTVVDTKWRHSKHTCRIADKAYVTQSSITVVPDDKVLHYIHLLVTYVVKKTPAVNNEPVPLSAVHYRNFIYSSPCAMDCLVA